MQSATEDDNWADVVGFEGSYKVSRTGDVLSVSRLAATKVGFRRVKPRLLRLRPIRKLGVVTAVSAKLCSPGTVSRTVTVPRIMLESFVGVRGPLWVASPLDGNNANLNLENWEWRRIGYTIQPHLETTVFKENC